MRMETSVVVNRPIEEVWAFGTDPFNFPRAGRGFLGLRQTSPGPMALGSTLQGRVRFLGLERRIEVIVTRWEPPHAGELAISGNFLGIRSMSLRARLEATTDGTRMTRVTEFEPRPILKPLWRILVLYWRMRVAKETNREIKRLLEAEQTSES
jgi:carbon monoxide dehydrogenase subunit G